MHTCILLFTEGFLIFFRVALGHPMAKRKPKAKAAPKAVKEEPKSIEEQLKDILCSRVTSTHSF